MHEASLIKNLIKQIEKIATEEKASRVTQVSVRLGALSHFTKEHFQEHFDEARKGTVAENAQLEAVLLTDLNDPQAQNVILESIEIERDR